MPVSRQIVLQEYRWARRAAILAASTAILGLPEPLAFGPRIPDAGTNPLGNQAALQFGHGTEDSENHLAGGRAGIHLLREGNEVNPEGLERFQGAEQVRHRPGEAVELPNRHGIETSAVGIGHESVQFWS
jgi:hypothetical protein